MCLIALVKREIPLLSGVKTRSSTPGVYTLQTERELNVKYKVRVLNVFNLRFIFRQECKTSVKVASVE